MVAASRPWFAPPVLTAIGISPFPIVFIDVELHVRGIRMFFFNPPAIAVLIANNCRRGTGRGQGEDADDP
jgi:hypothetical protein